MQVIEHDSKGQQQYVWHPNYPGFATATPLTYMLLAKACLSPLPQERPNFTQVLQVLSDLANEVARGTYTDTEGVLQVWPPDHDQGLFSSLLSKLSVVALCVPGVGMCTCTPPANGYTGTSTDVYLDLVEDRA